LVTGAEEDRVSALAAEAGIAAEFEDVVASSPRLASTTGARKPPGRPVRPARSEPAVTPPKPRVRQRANDSSRSTRGRGRGRGPR
jgi:hypothetical protein